MNSGQRVRCAFRPRCVGQHRPCGRGLDRNGYNNTGSLSEVAMSRCLVRPRPPPGNQFLDTQNTPGQINISHTFTDNTAAIDGKTATLSFDIGKMNIDWGGGYQTNADEKLNSGSTTRRSPSSRRLSLSTPTASLRHRHQRLCRQRRQHSHAVAGQYVRRSFHDRFRRGLDPDQRLDRRATTS